MPWSFMPDDLSYIPHVDELPACRALVEILPLVGWLAAVQFTGRSWAEIGELGHVGLSTSGVFLVGGL
jgi:hypothetical protein